MFVPFFHFCTPWDFFFFLLWGGGVRGRVEVSPSKKLTYFRQLISSLWTHHTYLPQYSRWTSVNEPSPCHRSPGQARVDQVGVDQEAAAQRVAIADFLERPVPFGLWILPER